MIETVSYFTKRYSARRGAERALKAAGTANPIEGTHFTVTETPSGWTWARIMDKPKGLRPRLPDTIIRKAPAGDPVKARRPEPELRRTLTANDVRRFVDGTDTRAIVKQEIAYRSADLKVSFEGDLFEWLAKIGPDAAVAAFFPDRVSAVDTAALERATGGVVTATLPDGYPVTGAIVIPDKKRKGWRKDVALQFLIRPEGCTEREVAEIAGWGNAFGGIRDAAKEANMELVKEKLPGKPTRYWAKARA